MSRSLRDEPSPALQIAHAPREPKRPFYALWKQLIEVSEVATRHHYHAPWRDGARRSCATAPQA